jgi:hypothetical protein
MGICMSLGGGGTLASLAAGRLSIASALDERVARATVLTDWWRETREGKVGEDTIVADLI